jgi:hypothetical protein
MAGVFMISTSTVARYTPDLLHVGSPFVGYVLVLTLLLGSYYQAGALSCCRRESAGLAPLRILST